MPSTAGVADELGVTPRDTGARPSGPGSAGSSAGAAPEQPLEGVRIGAVDLDHLGPARGARAEPDTGPPHPQSLGHREQRGEGGAAVDGRSCDPHDQGSGVGPTDDGARRSWSHPDGHPHPRIVPAAPGSTGAVSMRRACGRAPPGRTVDGTQGTGRAGSYSREVGMRRVAGLRGAFTTAVLGAAVLVLTACTGTASPATSASPSTSASTSASTSTAPTG